MPGGDREDDLVPVEGLERDAAVPARGADDAELELAPSDLLDHRLGVRDGERDVHKRMELLELAEDDGQHAAAGAGGRTDLEPALQLAFRLLPELREHLLLEREQPLRAAVEAEPGLGRLDPPAGAVEEPLALGACSSDRICRLTAGWVTPSWSAACEKLLTLHDGAERCELGACP